MLWGCCLHFFFSGRFPSVCAVQKCEDWDIRQQGQGLYEKARECPQTSSYRLMQPSGQLNDHGEDAGVVPTSTSQLR